jgi:hypothetical protein
MLCSILPIYVHVLSKPEIKVKMEIAVRFVPPFARPAHLQTLENRPFSGTAAYHRNVKKADAGFASPARIKYL